MPPLTYENLRATVGTRFTYGWQWDGEDSPSAALEPVDLTGWGAELLAVDGTGATVLDATVANALLVLGADGTIVLDVPPATLPAPGWYLFTLKLWPPSEGSDPTLFTQGRLDVRDPFTR